ncbi:cation transporter [Pseudomonas sp. HR96]|uniref:heavy-metal-associated domain-containing protein n=1 Tax=Pseudomonas sp. HR96 TaxID=1027966 RepID=UPI002A749E59|nr:cation transporter [Pseudomonas sp. HR96]WPP00518.1 cation transporter [Pseudomonas sp. HR96]
MQPFNVQGMTCAHCARAIESAIGEADPQARVEVEVASGQVRVDSSLSAEALIQLIEAEGYSAQRG